MKFSILRSKLLEALQTVQNVVSTKGALPILQNALLTVQDRQLTIATTDLDISEKCVVECECDVPGSTTLPIRRLTSIIRELGEDTIFIDVDEDDVSTIQCGSFYSKIIGMPMRDFPPSPQSEGSFTFTIDQGSVREMLKKTSYAVSLDETRVVLSGVLLSFKDSKLTMAATDGRRLALVEHEVEFPEDAETDIILPIKSVGELMRLLGNDGTVKICTQNGQALFDLGKTTLSSKLLIGTYPNYRQVIPNGCEERITIDRDLLMAAIRRVSGVSTDIIKLTFKDNELTVSSTMPNVGEGRDIVPIKYSGKEITIIFNPEFVMDPLKNMDDDEVYFELNDGHNPALIKCSIPFLYVLMPLRIN